MLYFLGFCVVGTIIGSKIARARPPRNLGSWMLDPGLNQNDSDMIRMTRDCFGRNPE